MQITPRARNLLRMQSLLFVVLFSGITGMLAWLSTQYVYQADWTAGARNTVSAATQKLLAGLDSPVNITAYVRDDDLLRKQISDLVGSYQRFRDDITLEFINPDTVPEQIRELGITEGGAIIISYHGASEQLKTLGETQFTNALLRLARQEERWIVFVSGHGERKPVGDTNHGFGVFAAELARKGLRVQTLTLAETSIPANTSMLVLASPQVELLPGEVRKLQQYLSEGGNLLWMAEPGSPTSLQPLADDLGFSFLPGIVVDANSQLFGVDDPAFIVVTGYPQHPVTREMTSVTVFPEVTAIDVNEATPWDVTPLLSTLGRSWTETGELAGAIAFDADTDERAGPLDIGLALVRMPGDADTGEAGAREQRVAVIGDGDFLSNSYLGNAGNLAFGVNLFHWLAHDDAFIDIQVRNAPDVTLELGRTAQAVIGLGFLLGLPVLLLLTGVAIWLRRRRR